MAMQTPEGTRGQTVLNDPEQQGGRQTNRLGFIAIERGSGERTGHVVSRSHSDININNGEGGEHHKGLRGETSCQLPVRIIRVRSVLGGAATP